MIYLRSTWQWLLRASKNLFLYSSLFLGIECSTQSSCGPQNRAQLKGIGRRYGLCIIWLCWVGVLGGLVVGWAVPWVCVCVVEGIEIYLSKYVAVRTIPHNIFLHPRSTCPLVKICNPCSSFKRFFHYFSLFLLFIVLGGTG